jgi:glutathione S-transferase
MQLYDGGRVPNARRVRIFLAEKGISLPMIPIDLGKSENLTPEFLALNPLGRVPVLVLDDGAVITESAAICRYIEALHPTPALFGATPRAIAEIEEWHRRLELELYFPIQYAFRHAHPAMAEREKPQVVAWGEANRPKALAMMELLDRHLEGRNFVAAEQYSVADIIGQVSLDFIKPAKIAIPETLLNLRRWHAAVAARPSANA